MASVRTFKRKYIPCRISLGLEAELHLVPTQFSTGTWVYRRCSLDDLKVSRGEEPMGVFYCDVWDLSGSGCRKAPCCDHSHLMACLACLLLAPSYTEHRGELLPLLAAWKQGVQGGARAGGHFHHGFSSEEVEAACGSEEVCAGDCMERAVLGHSYGCAPSSFPGCGLECLNQDE